MTFNESSVYVPVPEVFFQVTHTDWGYASNYGTVDKMLYQGPDADNLDDMHGYIHEEANMIGATTYTITYYDEDY